MERDFILNGIRMGEYQYDPEKVMEKIKNECIATGMNYIKFSAAGTDFGRQYFLDMARFLADNEIYFDMSYIFGKERPCGFDEETMDEMLQIAGKYYRAHSLAELGTKFGCAGSKYGKIHGRANESENMEDAKAAFDKYVDELIEKASFGGKIGVYITDATALISYSSFHNVLHPMLETACGNPEVMIPLTRACARATKSPMWCTYIAHEWYAGTRTLDPLKKKRLKMYYDYAYMSGSNLFILESGDECLYTHETHPTKALEGVKSPEETIYDHDHPVCQEYRKVIADFAAFVKKDFRPVGGPKVKVAFVQGNLDGYSPWRAGSSLWNCFDKKEFGYSTPEFVWRIFDDISTKRTWTDVHNFGEVDLSGAPAYGMYDIIPAIAGYEAFSRYDYLIFTGWNTMTDEIYDNLKKYVHGGGRLFMTAAHLNATTKRNGEMKLVHDGKVSDLFGCDLDVENGFCVNDGMKFEESIVPEVMYPASMYFDPLFSEGYVNYAKAELKGAVPTGRLSQAFRDKEVDKLPIWLTEHQYGEGYAILMTTLDYPGASAYTAYRNIVRELITASHRQAEIKIYGGDKLRFSVYEGNKIYLLNTDFDCCVNAIIDCGTKKLSITLEPGEFKVIEPKGEGV